MTRLDHRPGLADLAAPPRVRLGRHRLATAALSLVAHLALFAFLTSEFKPPPVVADPTPITVSLIEGLSAPAPLPTPPAPPTPKPPEPTPPKPEPVKPAPARSFVRPTPTPRAVETLAAAEEPGAEAIPEVSEAQLAQATTAGASAAGQACDMVRWLQGALRRNAQVQAAAARTHRAVGAKAILVWNGNWTRSIGEEGLGLAGVREAIMLEVAFAPRECRTDVPMNRMVLISLSDAAGSPRIVMGSGYWRWADLLNPRRPGPAAS